MTTEMSKVDNGNTEIENIAESILPQLYGDGIGDDSVSKRAAYLSKRICYFSVREACRLSNVAEKTVRRWREADSKFRDLDTSGLTKLREYLGANLVEIQFTRNMHLVLEKDFKVLYKEATEPDKMTDEEKSWMKRVRQYYTPQSLAGIKQLVSGKDQGEELPFSFTKFVVSLDRTTEHVQIQGERHGG